MSVDPRLTSESKLREPLEGAGLKLGRPDRPHVEFAALIRLFSALLQAS